VASHAGQIDRWWRQRSKMTLVKDGDDWRIEGEEANGPGLPTLRKRTGALSLRRRVRLPRTFPMNFIPPDLGSRSMVHTVHQGLTGNRRSVVHLSRQAKAIVRGLRTTPSNMGWLGTRDCLTATPTRLAVGLRVLRLAVWADLPLRQTRQVGLRSRRTITAPNTAYSAATASSIAETCYLFSGTRLLRVPTRGL